MYVNYIDIISILLFLLVPVLVWFANLLLPVESLFLFCKEQAPVYHPSPSISGSRAPHLSEGEQIRIAKRLGLIHHIPSGTYDGSKKAREWVECLLLTFIVLPLAFSALTLAVGWAAGRASGL